MTDRPVIVFDVNGTLSDTSALADAFAEQGADPVLARVWFASILRDGFGMTAAGGDPDFATLAHDLLPSLLEGQRLRGTLDAAVDALTGVLGALPPHDDVGPGLRALHDGGHRLAALTNGSTANADRILATAGVRDLLDPVLSVQDLGGWKPAGVAYSGAAAALGAAPSDLLLVAAHPWDLHGAAAVGLRTAWLRREDGAYPSAMRAPDLAADDLVELAGLLNAAGT